MEGHFKTGHIKSLKISFSRAKLQDLFRKELGFADIGVRDFKNALLRIRDIKNYPDSLDIYCREQPFSYSKDIIDITFEGWDFIKYEGDANMRETNYTDEEFFEDVKKFCDLINQA